MMDTLVDEIWEERDSDGLGEAFQTLSDKFRVSAEVLEEMPGGGREWAQVGASRMRSISAAWGVLAREYPLIGKSVEHEGVQQ